VRRPCRKAAVISRSKAVDVSLRPVIRLPTREEERPRPRVHYRHPRGPAPGLRLRPRSWRAMRHGPVIVRKCRLKLRAQLRRAQCWLDHRSPLPASNACPEGSVTLERGNRQAATECFARSRGGGRNELFSLRWLARSTADAISRLFTWGSLRRLFISNVPMNSRDPRLWGGETSAQIF
jgi:hypothetical protein